MRSYNFKKGFVVLYASLIGGVVLAIGLAILTITIKQLGLSSAGRESHKSFYVSDTAMECALYFNHLDRVTVNASCSEGVGVFADSLGLGTLCTKNPAPSSGLMCVGEELIFEPVEIDGASYISRFSLGVENSTDEICADVTITKDGSTGLTSFVSAGRNTCRDTQNKYERSIQIDF